MPEYYEEEFDSGSDCNNCNGSGWIVTCMDDMCIGAGECMHGDGEDPCPCCNKEMDKNPF